MIHCVFGDFQDSFERSFTKWYNFHVGYDSPNLYLKYSNKGSLPPIEIIAKNTDDAEYIGEFIDLYEQGKIGDFKHTSYWNNYLIHAYDDDEFLIDRCYTLIDLYNSMKTNGYDSMYPVYVADMLGIANLGFRYFRFDGRHRACCANKLCIVSIPCLIFSVRL